MSGLTRTLCRTCAGTGVARDQYQNPRPCTACQAAPRPPIRHACPTCKRQTLTTWEKSKGYQCRDCTAHDES